MPQARNKPYFKKTDKFDMQNVMIEGDEKFTTDDASRVDRGFVLLLTVANINKALFDANFHEANMGLDILEVNLPELENDQLTQQRLKALNSRYKAELDSDPELSNNFAFEKTYYKNKLKILLSCMYKYRLMGDKRI